MVSRLRKVRGFRLAVPLEIRFKDIDAMGHVNNAVFFTYFENARIAYWNALKKSRIRGDVEYVVARAECDFKSQVTLEDVLSCHIRVSSFGRSSFCFEYLIRENRSGRAIATGRTVQVGYDYRKGRVRPIGEPIRRLIRRFERRPIPDHPARA